MVADTKQFKPRLFGIVYILFECAVRMTARYGMRMQVYRIFHFFTSCQAKNV